MGHTNTYLYQHLHQYGAEPGVEWIIVDNGSGDGTPGLLGRYQEQFGSSRLTVIHNERNLGFPIACNQGARAAKGEVLLFLNNDVIIYGDYLKPIAGLIGDNTLIGAQLLSYDTGWNRFGDELVPYIPGWCLAITRAAFDELGGFDERYSPCDYEDIDLCYAASRAGKTLGELILPLRHISGATGQQMSNRRAITERNRTMFAEKWGLPL